MNREEYISEDGKHITLPVPYGSKFYAFTLCCCELCDFFKGDFDKMVCDELTIAPCHTMEGYVYECMMETDYTQTNPYDINNCLPVWGITCFETEEEARAAMMKKLEENRAYVTERFGIKLDEYGHYVFGGTND